MGQCRRFSMLLALGLFGCGDTDSRPDGDTDGATGSRGPSSGPSGASTDVTESTSNETADSTGDPTSDPTTGQSGVCGDGLLDAGELCDDGNTNPEDGCSAECQPEVELSIAYNLAPTATTHNSYSGADGEGDVGGIPAQLDAGVRTLELDVHNNDYAEFGYRVGHDGPGDEVSHGGGNPDTDALTEWFDTMASWSDAHPTHSPITVYIDLKDRFEASHFDDGNFGAFNALLEAQLGDRLYTPTDLSDDGQWPDVDEMQGRFVVVLTGDEDGQLAYLRDRARDPAFAINEMGQVIEVHQSEANEGMWLWTGQVEADGSIRWIQHASYDSGNRPSVAINNDGLIVEVHEDPDFADDDLWYRVGRLDADYVVQWSTDGGERFPGDDEGVTPTIVFPDLDDDAVREIHQSQSREQRWYWSSTTVIEAAGTIRWGRPVGDGTTNDPLYPRNTASYGGVGYSVVAGQDGPHDEALLYSNDAGTHRIRHDQLAFASARQSSANELLNDGLEFFADDGRSESGRAFIQQQNALGKLTRLWSFGEKLAVPSAEPINFGATDEPFAGWYVGYCAAVECVR